MNFFLFFSFCDRTVTLTAYADFYGLERGIVMTIEATGVSAPVGMITAECEKNTIQIFSYENRQLAGYLYNRFLNRGAYFSSELQIIWLMENLLDTLAFPQADVKYRSFSRSGRSTQKVEGNSMKDMITKEIDQPDDRQEKATFVVQVQFRRNATWQGTLQWVDKNQTRKFRSTLELLMLINDAMENGRDSGPSWAGGE